MILEHRFEQVPFHQGQRFAHGADGTRAAVAIERETGVEASHGAKKRRIFRFRLLARGVERRVGLDTA